MFLRVCRGLAVVLLCGVPILSEAATIRVDDATTSVGGASSLNVYISGTEDLAFFGFRLGITPAGGVTSTLAFVANTSYASDPNYVFTADSGGLSQDFTSPPAIDIQDFTASFDNVTLSATEQLLARVDLQHGFAGDPALAIGDTFTVSLIDTSDSLVTFFEDNSFNPFTPIFNSGTVTVTGAAVPEPGSWALLGLGVVCMAFVERRRRKKSKIEADER